MSMGRLETESRERTRKNQLRSIILGTIKVAGFVSLAVVAPNVIGAMGKMGLITSPQQKQVIRRSCERLVRQGLLKRENGTLRLTPRGEKTLQALSLRAQLRKRPKRWDGKWRVLIFDIPEYRASLRRRIRDSLREIGFVRLQHSVWVYPYDCEDFIALLKVDFRVGKDVLYMVVDALENENHLKRHFKLT